MPIYSMTGYARVLVRVQDGGQNREQNRENEQMSYTLSVKSVNHRFLDIQMRIPNGLDALEMDLRKSIKDALIRGHVDLSLSIDRASQQKAGYNRELVAGFIAAFNSAREDFSLQGAPDLNAVLRLPGAMQSDNRGEDDLTALSDSVRQQIGPLLEELKIMRAREGESLAAILNATLDRLTQRLLAATGPEFNRQRLLEEVAVIVERSDVAEELARMHTHIGHFRGLLAAGGEVGKKLDFLLQEMNREANTMLSKTGGVGGREPA